MAEPWDELRQHKWGQLEMSLSILTSVAALVLLGVLLFNELRGGGERHA